MLTANRIMGGIGKAGFFMGLGVAGGIGIAAKQAGDFQEKINVMGAVTGASGDQLEALRKKALALGDDLKLPNTSASDAADAMTELAKGGLSVKQVMEASTGTIQLATAAQTDNATAAQIQARALKAFNLDGTKAGKVADLMANAANASTAEITDLALGYQQASAVFHSSGQNIDTLTTAITEMADAGISGSDAGTSLRTMMSRLNPQTKKAKAEFKELGINVFDAQGHYKSMRDIIGEFHGALSKLNPKQKQHALYTIFGSDAIRAANIVLDGGVKKYDAYHKKIERTGTAQKMAQAHTKGFNGALQGFVSELQTAAINIGTLFLPVMTKWIRRLSEAAHWMSTHPKLIKVLAVVLGTLAVAMVTLTGFYKAYMSIQRLVKFYQELYKGSLIATRIQLWAMTAAEKIRAGVTKASAAAQWLLNAAMDANPIALVVIAIVALIAVFIILYKKSGTFREMIHWVWDEMKKFGSWVAGVFTKTIPHALGLVLNWVKKHWVDIVLLIVAPWLLIVKKAADAFGLREKLAAGLQTVIGKIKSWGGDVISFLMSLPGKFATWGARMGGHLKDAIVGGVKGMGTALVGVARGAINMVIRLWNGIAIPGFSWGVHKGPLDFSISIPDIPLPDITPLAQGAIVNGPTLALLGDNTGGREAVVPLPERGDLLGGGGTTVILNVEGSVIAERDLESKLLDVLTTYGRRNGRVRLTQAYTS